MRNKMIRGVLMLLLVATATIVGVTLSSCDTKKLPSSVKYVDEAIDNLDAKISSINNPVFVSTQEVLNYQAKLIADKHTDAIFQELSPDILTKVCNVLSTKGVKLTKSSILEEYERGHEIYDNLPPDSPKEYAKPDTAMEEQHTPSVSPTETQYSSYDTTINNKKAKVIVKKDITYE